MKPKDLEKTIARVTIEVQIVQGVQYYGEYGNESEEYVCVRDAKAVSSEALGNTGILAALDEGYFELPDPDGIIESAIRTALDELAPQRDYGVECAKCTRLYDCADHAH